MEEIKLTPPPRPTPASPPPGPLREMDPEDLSITTIALGPYPGLEYE